MTKLNKALLASTAIAFASGIALPAVAQDASAAPAVVKSSKKMKIKLYGQIARGFGFISDGENKQFRQAQLSTTSSRMGIDGRGKIGKGWSLRTRFEFQLVGDGSMEPTVNQPGDRADFRIRHTDAIFSHKTFGAIWIGRGDTASNGTSEVTLAPGMATAHLGGSLHQMANSVGLTDDTTGAKVAGATVNDFFNSYDGAGRATRMRYDTPTFMGLKASVSYIDAASVDAALRYSGKLGGTKIKAAVGYAMLRDTVGNFGDFRDPQDANSPAQTRNGLDIMDGSLSVLTPMGLGVTVSAGRERRADDVRDAGWNINPSIWYTMKATELGPTTFEGSFQYSKHGENQDDKGMAYGITAVQVLANSGTDTYVSFRLYDMDRAGADLAKVWVVGGGFRARF